MDVFKKDKNNLCNKMSFTQFVDDIELLTGKKQNKVKLNYKLLSREDMHIGNYTYSLKELV